MTNKITVQVDLNVPPGEPFVDEVERITVSILDQMQCRESLRGTQLQVYSDLFGLLLKYFDDHNRGDAEAVSRELMAITLASQATAAVMFYRVHGEPPPALELDGRGTL
jgi:hypothetical protein